MNNDVLAQRLRGYGPSVFSEMTRRAMACGAVNLSQGFPDFDGPEFVREAAIAAIRDGRNQYARMRGVPALTEAICADLAKRYDLLWDPATEVTVTSGATEALFDTFQAFIDPGDEVVLLEPYYDSYRMGCQVAGGVPKFVTLHAPDFRWKTEELEAAFSDSTKLLILNTPHNPTGRVFDRAELAELAELCRRYDVICVTDEVYDRLVYDVEHVPMATLPKMAQRTLTINSTAKTFSLTGWKIGYATGPEHLTGALALAHQSVTFSVATPFQHAMATAIAAPDDYFRTLQAEYRQRRDFLVDALQDCGFGVTAPEGTYFAMADIRPLGFDDDIAFCNHLLDNVGVAAIPPTAFYENKARGQFLVRFAFCKQMATLEAAVERLAKLKT